VLALRYRLPTPLLRLRGALASHARAAADVSDGLLADAGHIAEASGLGLAIDLERTPLSREGEAWRQAQADEAAALLQLASGGDDYALVCAVGPADEARFSRDVAAAGTPVATVGRFRSGSELEVSWRGRRIETPRKGWRHR